MFDCFENRVKLSGTLTTLTALRIGAGRDTGVIGTEIPVVRDALGRPYIPGSSLKGALRAGVEAMVRSVVPHRKGACIPTSDDEQCICRGAKLSKDTAWRYPEGGVSPDERVGIQDLSFKLAGGREDEDLASRVLAESCLVCRVFGSPWLAAKLSIRDLLVEETTWFGQFEARNGVAIDRDTETAAPGLLYDFEVVPAGTRFSCEMVVENAADWELGLLMAGLRPFEQGEAALGGGRSRGLGLVKIEWQSRSRVDRANLLDYLATDAAAADVDDTVVAGWLQAFVDHVRGQAGSAGAV